MTSSPPLSSSPPPQTQTQRRPAPKSIPSPRRLLILTPTSHSLATIPPLLHTLTGVPVDPPTATADTPTGTNTETETGAGTGTGTGTGTFAGYTTHPPLHIENRYYTAEVPIWVDEIPLPSTPTSPSTTTTTTTTETTPTQWRTEFSGTEARVVRDAIGGVMVCIRNDISRGGDSTATDSDVDALKEFLHCIGDVKRLVEEERGDAGFGEVLGVIALVGDKSKGQEVQDDDTETEIEGDEPFSVSWWEDALDDIGLMDFEVVSWDPRVEDGDKRDKYGEYQGMRRIRQILETHDWSNTEADAETEADVEQMLGLGGADDDLEEHLLGLDSSHGFNLEVNELEREMLGLRMAIERGGDADTEDDDGVGVDVEGGDDDLQVESMEALMLRMQAIKDMSAELPETERKRFAAKAVGDIMKEI